MQHLFLGHLVNDDMASHHRISYHVMCHVFLIAIKPYNTLPVMVVENISEAGSVHYQ